jgi:hypothetical protein
MVYFKLLELFVLRLLLNKGEAKPTHKNFNPVKLLIITILLVGTISGIQAFINLNKLYILVEKRCPEILVELKEKK